MSKTLIYLVLKIIFFSLGREVEGLAYMIAKEAGALEEIVNMQFVEIVIGKLRDHFNAIFQGLNAVSFFAI